MFVLDGDRTTEVAIGVSVGLLLITGGVLVITIICCLYRNICRNKHNSKMHFAYVNASNKNKAFHAHTILEK